MNDDDPQKRFTHVNPNMSIAPDGRIDMVWWDFRDGAGLYPTDVYYTYSYDNGQTWTRNFRVTEKSINRKVGTWSNNSDYRAPPALVSLEESALIGWDDTELGDEVSNTQDLMLAHVQLTELPGESSALPYVIAALVGLGAGGLVLLVIATRSRGRRPEASTEPAADRTVSRAGAS